MDWNIKVEQGNCNLTCFMAEFSIYPMMCLKGAFQLKRIFNPNCGEPSRSTPCTYCLSFFYFPFCSLRLRRTSPIFVSWSMRISSDYTFNRSFTASISEGFPSPLQFQETICIIYWDGKKRGLPWVALL